LKEENTKWLGIGASISTSYLINYFDIFQYIDCLVDDDRRKCGTYSPKYGIPVKSFDGLNTIENPTAIILAWQHSNLLINRLENSGFKGKIIIPLPHFQVIYLD
jgi:hypothetical protein